MGRARSPLSAADDAVARLDERLRVSPVRAGVCARADVLEAFAVLWAEGELVHPDDLVLHDFRRDARSASHALTRTHGYLRLRRKAARGDHKRLLTLDGLLELAGCGAGGVEAGEDEGDTLAGRNPAKIFVPEVADAAAPGRRNDGQKDELDAAFTKLTAATQAADEARSLTRLLATASAVRS